MNIVIIISANAEWVSVKDQFPVLNIDFSPFGEFGEVVMDGHKLIIFHGGWGKISAAASTQYVIDQLHPDLIVNLGTCGGFWGRIEIGTVVLVDRTLVYDIIEQMGESADAIEHYTASIDLGWLPHSITHPTKRCLMVSADRDIITADIPYLIDQHDAVAADWESGAIAWVANRNATRVLILRSVTDLVGLDGGEAYGNIELFRQRTKIEMKKLFDLFAVWLGKLENPA